MTVRRLKTYTGQTGYVYQYYFVGKRAALEGEPATEYVFDVSSDRQSYFTVSILVEESALQSWAASHERELSESEQYAIGKMALFQAFDEVNDLGSSARQFVVTREIIESLVETLDL